MVLNENDIKILIEIYCYHILEIVFGKWKGFLFCFFNWFLCYSMEETQYKIRKIAATE